MELGAKLGLVAPNDTTIDWVRARPFAPTGADLDQAIASWRTLRSDDDAEFDREVTVDVATIGPTLTWGTSPEHNVSIEDVVPDPALNPRVPAVATRTPSPTWT